MRLEAQLEFHILIESKIQNTRVSVSANVLLLGSKNVIHRSMVDFLEFLMVLHWRNMTRKTRAKTQGKLRGRKEREHEKSRGKYKSENKGYLIRHAFTRKDLVKEKHLREGSNIQGGW